MQRTIKKCRQCGTEQPAAAFYRHKGFSDGLFHICKECHKHNVRTNYRANKDHYKEYEQQRFQRPDRKSAIARYQRKRRERHPLKYRASYAVSNAIRDGRLTREPCEICGHEPAEAHHDDYSKPLDVRWLCRKHHLEHHGKEAY